MTSLCARDVTRVPYGIFEPIDEELLVVESFADSGQKRALDSAD